jgi:hypothetical protein
MALRLAGRNPARFEYDDGVSQTIVVIAPDDEPDTVRAKLQRVLELEGHILAEWATPAHPPGARSAEAPTFTPADRAATEERLAKAETMGWESTDVDALPEA